MVIERAGDKFIARSSPSGKKSSDAAFRPQPFATLQEATSASRAWAQANDIPVVYLRDIP